MKFLFSKIKTAKEAWIYLLLGLSPLGIFVPSSLLWTLGICRGALGSGISCYIPFFETYPGVIMVLMEVSMMIFGLGLLWIGVAFWIWIKLFIYIFFGRSLRTKILVLACICIFIGLLFSLYDTFQTKIPYALAQEKHDESYCTYIQDESIRTKCVFEVLEVTNSTQLTDCEPLVQAHVSDEEQAKCFINLAKVRNDVRICDGIRAWGITDPADASQRCYAPFIGTEQWKKVCEAGNWLPGAECTRLKN